jgi:hypothetical protein
MFDHDRPADGRASLAELCLHAPAPAVRREDAGDHGSLPAQTQLLLRLAANDARAATLAIEKALSDGDLDPMPDAILKLKSALDRASIAR